MQLTQIFNILLLTLSLATILLTLVSYILYRIRQIPEFQPKTAHQVRIQGVFFKRYLPAESLAAETANAAARAQQGLGLSSIPRNIVPFFGVTASVIFLSLLLSQWLKPTELDLEKARVQNFRALRAKGLLKDYELASRTSGPAGEEWIAPAQLARVESRLASLRNRGVALVDLELEQKYNPVHSREGVENWTSFFETNRIPFRKTTEIPCSGDVALVVIPQAAALSRSHRDALQECFTRGIAVVATGPIGVYDGTGANADPSWASELFGVRFAPNPDPGTFLATQLSGDRGPHWEVPSGMVLDWLPSDNRFQAIGTLGSTHAYESTYKGRANAFSRAQFVSSGKSRRVWLAFDAIPVKATLEGEKFHARMAIAGALSWAVRAPLARVTTWPNAAPGATLLSVDSEDQFTNVRGLQKLFLDAQVQATFFLVSNLFQSDTGAFSHSPDSAFELASHSENHGIFEGQSLQEQFDRIQASRIEIEEITGRKVAGFRAPFEKADDATLAAVAANHLDYIVGNGKFTRFSPVWLAAGKLLYFPRMSLDDFGVDRTPDLDPAQGIPNTLAEETLRAQKLGGMAVLNFHTQLFGKKRYDGPLSELLHAISSQGNWTPTYSQATQWWKDRESLTLSLRAVSERQYELVVENPTDSVIDGIGVELDLGSGTAWKSIAPGQPPSLNALRTPASPPEFNRVRVGKLAPHQSRTFLFDAP